MGRNSLKKQSEKNVKSQRRGVSIMKEPNTVVESRPPRYNTVKFCSGKPKRSLKFLKRNNE